MEKKQSENIFENLWMDAHPSLAPKNTLSYVLNGVKQTDRYNKFGYSNEKGTELCASLPDGYKMRGYTQIPERNEFVIFSFNGTNSEIGAINTDECSYKTYFNDTEHSCKLEFGFEEWIGIEVKRIQPCNEIVLYWSNNRTYRYLNIDEADLKNNKTCDKLRLFKCNCAPKVKLNNIENGGYGVPNGIYQVAVRLTDEDSNYTNWFKISQHAKIFGGDNKAGEISDQYVSIQLSGLSQNYNFIDVAIIKTIDYKTTVHLIYDKQPYNSNGINLDYRGPNDEIRDLTIQEIQKKEDYWISGKGLIQKDNRLILYDVDNHWNLDYQETANKIKVGFAVRRVRVEDAYKYPTLLRGENYMFGIEWNYCDGTKSVVFPLINRAKSASDAAIVDDKCSDCPREAWEIKDTSIIEMTHSGYGDPYQESAASEKVYKNHIPIKEPFKTVDEWGEDAKKEGEDLIKEINKDAEKDLQDEEDLLDNIAGGDCCDGPTVDATENTGNPDPVVTPVVVTPPGNGDGNPGTIVIEYEGSNNGGGTIPPGNECTGGSGFTQDCPVGTHCENGYCVPNSNGELGTRSNPLCIGQLCEDGKCPEGCDCIDDPTWKACDSGNTFCKPGVGGCKEPCVCVELEEGDPEYPDDIHPGRCRNYGETTPPKICVPKKDDPTDPGAENNDHDSNVPCQPIYDEDGCTVIDCIPLVVMTGQFGYSESKETYPTTLKCDGKLMFGEELAGERIRQFRVPTAEKIPFFISYMTGVTNIQETGNDELDRGYADVIGLNLTGIEAPKDTPKPLCGTNPFSIVMIKRDESNKTILAKGLLLPTFEGDDYGTKKLYPSNGVSSLELFNRHINSTTNKVHAGYLSETAGYTFHSPTTAFSKPYILGSKFIVDQEHYGKGWRHGLYASGDQPGTPELHSIGGIAQILTKGNGLNVPKIGQKGYRAAVHLNKFKLPEKTSGEDRAIRCIKDVSYVGADKVLKKGPNFTLPFSNKDSEACVFIQLDDFYKLGKGIDPFITGEYNGQGGNLAKNQTRDGSFLGNVKFFEGPIYNAAALYGGIVRENKRQYGRLESAAYIPTGIEGTWQDLINGSITGACGDTYITPYSFTKSSYISNLVGDNVLIEDPLTFSEAADAAQNAPETGPGKRGGKAQGGTSKIKKLVENMTGAKLAWALGLCANIPVAGLTIKVDPRNGSGLRGFNNDPDGDPADKGGGYWDGKTIFDGNPAKDKKVYYPGVQKTEIITWVESDVAVPLRIKGKEQDKEINYFDTKGYDLDSSFHGNVAWKDKYLNMFYMEFPEISLYQRIWITFVIFAIKIIFPLYILLQLGGYIHGGGGIAGALLSIIIQIVLLIITIVFVILLYIALKTFASPYLLQFLGIKQCFNDKQGGPGDGFKKDFHDNFNRYNWNYSSQNELNPSYGAPINYNTCLCVAEPSNKIIYSNPQIIGAANDAWRNFKVNNMLDITSKYGKITTMIIRGQKMFAACTDMILDLQVGTSTLEFGDATLELGKGDYINAAIPIADGVLEGYAGIKYPNGSINTALGFIFIDEEAGRIYNFNGGAPEEISNYGVRQFMKENLKFEYLKARPNFANVDQKSDEGIGYAIGYDYKNERLLITKRDFLPSPDGKVMFNGDTCIDKSWTYSYDPMEKKWLSEHSYTPHLYMFDRFNIYSPLDSKIWQYNVGKKYQTYFGKYYPFIIEYSSVIDGFNSYQHEYTMLDTEANLFNEKTRTYAQDLELGFNKGFFYNSNQATRIMDLVSNPKKKTIKGAMIENSDTMIMSKEGRTWRYSDIADYSINTEIPLFIKDEQDKIQLNTANISKQMKHKALYDKYIVSRFVLDNAEDINYELICKRSLGVFGDKSM